MAKQIIKIPGTIINADRQPLSNLRVEAWDKDLIIDDFLGSAITDSDGGFVLEFSLKSFRELFFDRRPDLFFKVFNGDQLIHSTADSVLWNIDSDKENLEIIIDMNVEDNDARGKIVFRGFVKHSNGNPVKEMKVVVSKQLLRGKNKLAETITDATGFYSVAIEVLPKNTACVLETIDSAGKSLSSSYTIYNPEKIVNQDLTITDIRYKGESAFNLKQPVLQEYYKQLHVSQDEKPLSVDDVFFIANQTKLDPRDTFHWLRANEMETETRIPAEAFYGMFKQGLPTHLKALSSISGKEIHTAIEKAATASFISDEIAAEAAKMVEQWNQYIVGKALDEVPDKMGSSLGQVLGVALKDRIMQEKVLTAYLDHEGTLDEFWDGLQTLTGNDTSAEKIQTALKLGVFSGNQPDVMEALMNTESKSGNIFHELAAMDRKEWVAFVIELSDRKRRSIVPPFIEGRDEDERIEKYADQMAAMLEQNFPTHSFFGKLAKQNPEQSAFSLQPSLVKFFANNATFDIKKTPTISLLDEDSQFNFEGVENKQLLVQELQSIQRLSSYTANFDVMSVLKTNGMDTAYDIVSISESNFIQNYGHTFGSVEATQIAYKQAENNYMLSVMVWAGANPNLSFKTAATPGPIASPALRTLFGTLDTCECEHCTSVYSPAAYYTDILNFMYSRTPDVYNELIRRRPDLIHIELSCKNTNTPLPYVDLVNELLENFVLTHKNSPVPDPYQTTWQANELAANPEHINYSAYDELKKAVYPRVLPFNLPLEEARIYLKHLGIEKHQLMVAFFAGKKEAAFDDFSINMERLHISLQEAQILTGETTGDGSTNSGLWNFYGFDKATGYKPITDPADSSKQVSAGNWDIALTSRVDIFLQQTGLIYKDLLNLLLCNSINPVIIVNGNETRDITIVSIDGNNDSCALDNLSLKGMTTLHLQKIYRFLRLLRRLDWTMYDLDKAIAAFNLDFGNNIAQNKKNLNKISQAGFLSNLLRLPLVDVLSFWSDINTAAYIHYSSDSKLVVPSLYEKLFRNKAVLNPVDPAFADPAALAGVLDDHKPTILAAMQISDEDYSALKSELADNKLTLSNLSVLYRNVLLAGKLKLKLKDFISLKKLIGTSADAFASPVATFTFLQKADTIDSFGFNIEQLLYLLNHDYIDESAVAPTDNDISVFLSEVRSSLRTIENATAEEQRNTIVQKFSGKLKITASASDLLLQKYVMGITNPAKNVVEDFRADIFSTIDFLKTYSDISNPLNPKDFEPVFIRTNPTADVKLVAVPDLFNDYVRVDKVATIIRKLKLSDTDLENILANCSALNCTDLTQLPIAVTAGNFNQFETLVNLIKARDMMPVGSPDFMNILLSAITSPTKTKWFDNLIARTNWDKQIIKALVGDTAILNDGGILKTNFPADFMNGDIMLQIKNCLNTLSRTGISTSLVEAVIVPDFDNMVPDAIKNAAKAKYDEFSWLKLAKPLRDDLREKQREALVAFVVAHADFNSVQKVYERWKNSDELYEYLLIDVEMKPISMTSRIKQAICSVQLFIDRVLMNLEHPDSDPTVAVLKLNSNQVEEWKTWRRIYRVWEANRKIFLYPENWLEPELRDNKSPFFKDLETLLKQNELSDENVEDAFHVYLNKLDEVARLEVVGLYHQTETGVPEEDDIDILHVFARTYSNPHKYFHCTLENGEWSEWEKLEIDIDGNHIVPVIFNRKLCLFWLFFTQETDEITTLEPSASTIDSPLTQWKIQVAWSEYRKNHWTAKRLSRSYITSSWVSDMERLEMLRSICFISTTITNDKLYLSLGGISGSAGAFIFNNTNDNPSVGNKPYQAVHKDSIQENINNVTANQQMLQASTTKIPFDLYIHYASVDKNSGSYIGSETLSILDKTSENEFRLVIPSNEHSPSVSGPLYSAFFFQDEKNTFYVTHSKVPASPIKDSVIGFNTWNQGITNSWGGMYEHFPVVDPVDPGIDEYFKFGSLAPNISPEVKTYALTPGLDVNNQGQNMTLRMQSGMKGASFDSYVKSGNVSPDNNFVDYVGLVISGKALVTKYNEEDRFTFTSFYHAHVKSFIKELNKLGIKGLLKRSVQTQKDSVFFDITYSPTNLVVTPYPAGEVDFGYGSVYSQYNWELFFHVPMLIACRLKDDQRFEEARDWFHFIFNPTNSEGGNKERFWQFRPFYDEAGKGVQTLSELLKNQAELALQIQKWMKDPFKPHVIARMRIATYMKNVVMKYLDNLISCGDNLFRHDTIEAINEATNLYILAAKILGERPPKVPPRAEHAENDFFDIKDNLDSFSNAMVKIETMISPSSSASSGTGPSNTNALGKMSYFCVPGNEYLMKYWDTVADRLFKIRHSMNIEGVMRTLPLFEPPIDPSMLVRATAAGMDLSSILSDINAGLPNYRFSFILSKAHEFTNELKALGSVLLQALEKSDAEALALLRSAHEQKLMDAVLYIKEKQVDDAKEQLESIFKSKEIVQWKYDYYSSRELMNNFEKQQLDSIQLGMMFSIVQGELNTISSVLAAIPNLKAGAPTSMGVTWGGDNLGAMMNAISTYMGIFATINNAQGSMAGTRGSFQRRMDDWHYQADNASLELKQVDRQIISNEIKLAIAEKDLVNQQLQIANSKEADEFMRSKYTNQQLYDWMVGQLSTVYFQSYQLAYDLAKKAEKCYQYELGEYDTTSFVKFGYWDSLKKGLLSAEKLQYDLRRMESSFYDKNKREYELTKHISLAKLDPVALLQLKQTGECFINLPEEIFDLDYPGHYFRRIKSVSLSIPCIAGPLTTMGCTLTIMNNSVRIDGKSMSDSKKYPRTPSHDPRFRDNSGKSQSIVLSHAQTDSGLFELNFRDERYLPFEGAGAISTWHLQFPFANTKNTTGTKPNTLLQQFDYNTISDMVLHLKYTAREGENALKTNVSDNLINEINKMLVSIKDSGLMQMFSLKHDFPNEFNVFLNQPSNNGDQICNIQLDLQRLPYFVSKENVKITSISLFADAKILVPQLNVTSAGNIVNNAFSFTSDPALGNIQISSPGSQSWGNNTLGLWKIVKPGKPALASADLNDIYILINYSITS